MNANDTINYINAEGLQFFGRVNASISHELKNILAIISETSGFLNDLTDLARQGEPLNLSLLGNCNQSIAEEIQRGFTTIKKMNRFAHSVDVPVTEIDLMDTLSLTAQLAGFLSTTSTVRINADRKGVGRILTSPFLLQNLIYRILCLASETAGPDGEISILVSSDTDSGDLMRIHSPVPGTWNAFPTPKIEEAARILGIEMSLTDDPEQLQLKIPYVSNQIVALAKVLQL
tara:strand:+ start:65 stop:757 length:693 start_codon:yes stop_codon:yes gene_type:complete